MASPQFDGPMGWPMALVAAMFGGGGFWAWWAARSKARTEAPAAHTAADAALVEALGKYTGDFGGAAAALVAHFSRRCDALEEKNGKLEAKVDEIDARHEDCQRSLEAEKEHRAAEIAKIRAEFDAYIAANPPAGY